MTRSYWKSNDRNSWLEVVRALGCLNSNFHPLHLQHYAALQTGARLMRESGFSLRKCDKKCKQNLKNDNKLDFTNIVFPLNLLR